MALATHALHRYQLKHKISDNTGKQTFIAKDLHKQVPVIVKVIPLNQLFQWAELKLFEREATILKSLNHPAIPKFIDYFEAEIDGTHSFVLVQSYLAAESLETHLKAGRRFSTAEVRDIAWQMLSLLTYLHRQSPPIVHRDIKPSNILLAHRPNQDNSQPACSSTGYLKAQLTADATGEQPAEAPSGANDVYLVDFGAVHTSLTKESGTITIVGSYGYIPLEQFSGQSCPASDLYSLGMTLIALMTGLHPAELPQVEGHIQFAELIAGNISQEQQALVQWLERMVQPYLYKRFQSAEEAFAALELTEGKAGYYHHLKPANSTVEVKRDHNRLEISIIGIGNAKPVSPQKRVLKLAWLPGAMIYGLILASVLWPFATIAFLIILELISKTGTLLLSAMVIGLLAAFIGKLFTLPKTHRVISIHCTEGIRTGIRTGNQSDITWDSTSCQLQAVDLIAYSPGYTFSEYFDGTDSKKKQGKGSESPKLSLYNGDRELEIAAFFWLQPLSRAELWWLGQEISAFLDLELQTIYSTPVVSPVPENSCGCGC